MRLAPVVVAVLLVACGCVAPAAPTLDEQPTETTPDPQLTGATTAALDCDAVTSGTLSVEESVGDYAEPSESDAAYDGADGLMAYLKTCTDRDLAGVGVGVRTTDDGGTIYVHRDTVLDRDGTVVSEPDTSYERVAEVAPDEVTVTFEHDGESSWTIPVVVQNRTIQQD